MFAASICWMERLFSISNLCCLAFRTKSCVGGGWRKLRRDGGIDVADFRSPGQGPSWDSTAPSPEGPCPGLRKSATSIPPSRLSFRQPPPTQLFVRNARQQRFDIEKRRSIQHIDAANMQLDAVAAKQLHNSQPNRIRPPWRSRRKHSMRAIVRRRRAEQFESLRPVKFPEHDKMRETFNISKPRLKLRQNFQNPLSLMLGAKPPGNLTCILVRTTHKSNRPRGKHDEWC